MEQQVRIILLTLAVHFTSIACVKCGSAGKINEYLVKNCNTVDFKSNLKTAQQYLDFLSVKSSMFDHRLVNDLKTFTALKRIENGETQCNLESRKILTANNKLAGDLIKVVKRKGAYPLTRYNSLVWSAIQKHAATCSPTYNAKYRQMIETLDKDMVNKVDALTVNTQLAYRNWKKSSTEEPHSSDAKRAHESLIFMVKKFNDKDKKYATLVNDEPNGKKVLNKEKYIELFERFIMKPCEYFVKKLGPDVFEPSLFDAQVNNSMPDPLHKYQICKSVIGTYSKSFLKEVISFAEKSNH